MFCSVFPNWNRSMWIQELHGNLSTLLQVFTLPLKDLDFSPNEFMTSPLHSSLCLPDMCTRTWPHFELSLFSFFSFLPIWSWWSHTSAFQSFLTLNIHKSILQKVGPQALFDKWRNQWFQLVFIYEDYRSLTLPKENMNTFRWKFYLLRFSKYLNIYYLVAFTLQDWTLYLDIAKLQASVSFRR